MVPIVGQYFGGRAAQDHVRQREGGILWHTQGSGKCLTTVWLAKWIREHVNDAPVLIITDRTELDEQIEKVFQGVSEDIYRTPSAAEITARRGVPCTTTSTGTKRFRYKYTRRFVTSSGLAGVTMR